MLSRIARRMILIVALAFIPFFFVASASGFWLNELSDSITQGLKEKRFMPSTEFYSAPIRFFRGQKIQPILISQSLERLQFRKREAGQAVLPGDWTEWNQSECEKQIEDAFPDGGLSCYVFRNRKSTAKPEPHLQAIVIGSDNLIFDVVDAETKTATIVTELEPELFAQFYGSEAIMKEMVDVGQTPPLCLNALLAIEDSHFLEHQGVSPTALLRAFYRNLVSGRYMEGGSTITQQLVKNYFLTHEKTMSRKLKEIVIAVIVENNATKDEILQAYINEIYMGQNGPFQVRGFASASQHYFGKKLSTLNLSECALLAAIVNSPARYSPFANPERAAQRRALVLSQMKKLEIIDEATETAANAAPLPDKPKRVLTEPAPYFVDAVRRRIDELGLDTTYGLRVYTTLDLMAQEAAQNAVRTGLDELEKNHPKVKMIKEAGKNLEGLLLSADPLSGRIHALVGGRGFKISQFNRAVQSRRQVGSVMKPLVYLTALQSKDPDGNTYTPLTMVNDVKTTYEVNRKPWAPENYENEYYGRVPLFFALANSLNASTTSVGMQVGLEPIINIARLLGATSDLAKVPSLTLGALEMSPLEVLQMYTTLAAQGEHATLTTVDRIEKLDGTLVWKHDPQKEQVLPKEDVAVLVGIMRQTLEIGTGRGTRARGFTHPAAGKTGTTNDNRDAWFAGFTPLHSAVVWVGYDDNTVSGLTGGSGAVPVWTEYMKSVGAMYPPLPFKWPDGVREKKVSASDIPDLDPKAAKKIPLDGVSLLFRD